MKYRIGVNMDMYRSKKAFFYSRSNEEIVHHIRKLLESKIIALSPKVSLFLTLVSTLSFFGLFDSLRAYFPLSNKNEIILFLIVLLLILIFVLKKVYHLHSEHITAVYTIFYLTYCLALVVLAAALFCSYNYTNKAILVGVSTLASVWVLTQLGNITILPVVQELNRRFGASEELPASRYVPRLAQSSDNYDYLLLIQGFFSGGSSYKSPRAFFFLKIVVNKEDRELHCFGCVGTPAKIERTSDLEALKLPVYLEKLTSKEEPFETVYEFVEGMQYKQLPISYERHPDWLLNIAIADESGHIKHTNDKITLRRDDFSTASQPLPKTLISLSHTLSIGKEFWTLGEVND